jgi:hypothetical protein
MTVNPVSLTTVVGSFFFPIVKFILHLYQVLPYYLAKANFPDLLLPPCSDLCLSC